MFNTCKKCGETKPLNLFARRLTMRLGVENTCKACRCKESIAWVSRNKEKVNKLRRNKYAIDPSQRIAAHKKWATANPEKLAVSIDRWHKANVDKRRAAVRKWCATNKPLRAFYTAKRNAVRKQAIPAWADLNAIADVYTEAAYFQMEVDHIVPLISPTVQGLHVWDNLQLLTSQENGRKSNKLWPDMP